nr:phosphoglycerate mutase [Cedratvirus borely]
MRRGTIKNLMRIYIRHAEKEHVNGSEGAEHPFDPSLTEEGMEKCSEVADELYKTFGMPTLIIVSPFLRTRQTATVIRSRLLQLSGQEVQMVCENKVGEYLGNHRITDKNKAFTYKTRIYKPRVETCMSHFDIRVKKHNDEMGSLDGEDFNFWIITHGLVIKKISKFNGCYFPGYPNFLSGLVIGDKITTFGNWK